MNAKHHKKRALRQKEQVIGKPNLIISLEYS
jgi:hypothetical protein